MPFAGTQAPKVTVEAAGPDRFDVQTLRLRWEDGTTDELIFTSRLAKAIEERDGMVTDAALVHLQKDAAGKLINGLVVDGTYLTPYVAGVRSKPETFRMV